jgi:hypothetical protein
MRRRSIHGALVDIAALLAEKVRVSRPGRDKFRPDTTSEAKRDFIPQKMRGMVRRSLYAGRFEPKRKRDFSHSFEMTGLRCSVRDDRVRDARRDQK